MMGNRYIAHGQEGRKGELEEKEEGAKLGQKKWALALGLRRGELTPSPRSGSFLCPK